MLFQLSAEPENSRIRFPASLTFSFYLKFLFVLNIPCISESIFRVYHNSPIFASKKCFCPIQFICIPHRSRLSVRLREKKNAAVISFPYSAEKGSSVFHLRNAQIFTDGRSYIGEGTQNAQICIFTHHLPVHQKRHVFPGVIPAGVPDHFHGPHR